VLKREAPQNWKQIKAPSRENCWLSSGIIYCTRTSAQLCGIQTHNLARPQESNRQQVQPHFWTLKKQAIKLRHKNPSLRIAIGARTDWSIMDLNTAAGCFWLILWDSKDAPRMYYYIMYAELLLCATATAPADARCHLMSPQGFAAVGSWAPMSLSPLAVAFGARTLHSAKK